MYAESANRKSWFLPIVLILLVLSGALLPVRSLTLLAILVLVGVAGFAGFLFFQSRTQFGLYALAVFCVFSPIEIGTGTSTTIPLAFVVVCGLVGLWAFDMLVVRRQIQFISSPTMLPLGLFMLAAVGAFLAGQFPWFPTEAAPLRAQIGGLAIFLISGAAFLLVSNRVASVESLERITIIFIVLGGLLVLIETFPTVAQYVEILNRPKSIGSLFWTWLATMAFAMGLFHTRLGRSSRLFLFGLAVLVLLIGLLRRDWWVSGWLPPLVGMTVILALRLPRLVAGVGVLMIPVGILLSEKFWGFLMLNEQYSLITRLEAWRVLAEIVNVNPILGLGPANYYYYTSLFPILGWYVNFNSHNNYVDILAQTGILGLIAFLWFFIALLRLSWRLIPACSPGFERAYAVGIVGGTLGTLVASGLGDWVVPFVYNIGMKGFRSSVLVWIFAGGLVALERVVRNRQAARMHSVQRVPHHTPSTGPL